MKSFKRFILILLFPVWCSIAYTQTLVTNSPNYKSTDYDPIDSPIDSPTHKPEDLQPHDTLNLMTEFNSWNQTQAIPGVYVAENPESSTKVYRGLFQYLYADQDLNQQEIQGIPQKLNDRLLLQAKAQLRNVPQQLCATEHAIEFPGPQSVLKISDRAPMKGFEGGLMRIESRGCLALSSTNPLDIRAADLILDPNFRLKALKDSKKVWISHEDSKHICEHMHFQVAFFDIGTSIYCLETQRFQYQGTSILKVWAVSNGLRADGMTLPVFFNEQIFIFQQTSYGLFVHVNSYIRGLGGASAPRGQLKKLLVDRQNHFFEVLKTTLQKP